MDTLMEMAESMVEQGNINTQAKLTSDWVENTRMNLAFLYQDSYPLMNAEKGNTVLIVSGGASWKKNVEWLKKSPFPIIAIDYIYPYLNKEGVNVKYVVAIDPIRKPIGAGKCKLLFDIKTNYELVGEWEGERYAHLGQYPQFSNDIFTDMLMRHEKVHSIIPSGGNAATRALVIARELLRAKRIVLVSHDYCDLDDRTYEKKKTLVNYHIFGENGDLPARWVKDDYFRYAAWTRKHIDRWLKDTEFVITENYSMINDIKPNPAYEILSLRKFMKRELKHGGNK